MIKPAQLYKEEIKGKSIDSIFIGALMIFILNVMAALKYIIMGFLLL